MEKKFIVIPAAVIVIIVGAVLSFLCVRTVDVGQVAVVTEFGSVKGVQTNGFHLKSPMEDYNYIDVTQQAVTNGYSTATSDNQSLSQTITAQVAVEPESAAGLYSKFLGGHMDNLVAPMLADAFKSATAGYSIEQVISNRGDLGNDMLDAAKAKLEPYGISVVSVEITNVELPDDYKAAVEARKVAEQQLQTAEVERQTAEVNAETNRITAESLSSENFTQMFIEKWDGQLPQYVGGEDGLSMILPK